MFNPLHIIEGVINATIGRKEGIEKIAAERKAICDPCEYNSEKRKEYSSVRPDFHCTACGCNIRFKTHSMKSECPTGKWGAVTVIDQTDDEAESYRD